VFPESLGTLLTLHLGVFFLMVRGAAVTVVTPRGPSLYQKGSVAMGRLHVVQRKKKVCAEAGGVLAPRFFCASRHTP
jgi:hypothetical protein